MLFTERQKIILKYRKWLIEEREKNDFQIKDCPETFLVFLASKGYLKEKEENLK